MSSTKPARERHRDPRTASQTRPWYPHVVLAIVAFGTISSLALVPGANRVIVMMAGLAVGAAVFLLVRRLAAGRRLRPAAPTVTLIIQPDAANVAPAPAVASAAGASVLVTPMVSITHSENGGRSPAPRSRPRPKKTLVGIGQELIERTRATPAPEVSGDPAPAKARTRPDPALLDLHPAPATWTPDTSLVPAKRRALADQLLARALTRCFVIAVFGTPETAARKSKVAGELALALSASGEPRTLLLEANLQQPRLHHVFGVSMPASCGFSQQLSARIRGDARHGWNVVACRSNLHALVEGLMLSPGVVLSTHFEACIRELRGYYDLIVIDGPFSSERADYRAVEAVVDGVLRLEGAQSSPTASPRLLSPTGERAFEW